MVAKYHRSQNQPRSATVYRSGAAIMEARPLRSTFKASRGVTRWITSCERPVGTSRSQAGSFTSPGSIHGACCAATSASGARSRTMGTRTSGRYQLTRAARSDNSLELRAGGRSSRSFPLAARAAPPQRGVRSTARARPIFATDGIRKSTQLCGHTTMLAEGRVRTLARHDRLTLRVDDVCHIMRQHCVVSVRPEGATHQGCQRTRSESAVVSSGLPPSPRVGRSAS